MGARKGSKGSRGGACGGCVASRVCVWAPPLRGCQRELHHAASPSPSGLPASPKREEELLQQEEEASHEDDEWGPLVSERD